MFHVYKRVERCGIWKDPDNGETIMWSVLQEESSDKSNCCELCGCDGRKGRFVVVEENWICNAMLCKGHRERIVWHNL